MPAAASGRTAMQSIGFVFLLGLLQGVYTVTGFDASAHTVGGNAQRMRAKRRAA